MVATSLRQGVNEYANNCNSLLRHPNITDSERVRFDSNGVENIPDTDCFGENPDGSLSQLLLVQEKKKLLF